MRGIARSICYRIPGQARPVPMMEIPLQMETCGPCPGLAAGNGTRFFLCAGAYSQLSTRWSISGLLFIGGLSPV